MDAKKLELTIKTIMLECGGLTGVDAGRILHTSPSNYNRKLREGTLRATELINLLNGLGYRMYVDGNGERRELR